MLATEGGLHTTEASTSESGPVYSWIEDVLKKKKTAWIYIYLVHQVLGVSMLAFPNSSRF